MQFVRVSRNAWGQETLLGVSWDLLWLFVGAAVLFVVLHVLYRWFLAPKEDKKPLAEDSVTAERLVRHKLLDRLYHWTMATLVLVLMGTSFLPILGLKFPWIDAHWIAGTLLTVIVPCHVVRALFWQDPRSMLIGIRELRGTIDSMRWLLRGGDEPARPGRYPLLQKLYHHGIAVLVLCIVATGLPMIAKIDGPFWTRNPYMLSSDTWAVIYVLHDLAAMAVLAAFLVHIYFALRPEKIWNTRGMLLGWITRSEYLTHYDPKLWRAEPVEEASSPVAGAVAAER